jgi:hypothetical protein
MTMGLQSLEAENRALKEQVRILKECTALLGKIVTGLLGCYSRSSERLYRLEELLDEYFKARSDST